MHVVEQLHLITQGLSQQGQSPQGRSAVVRGVEVGTGHGAVWRQAGRTDAAISRRSRRERIGSGVRVPTQLHADVAQPLLHERLRLVTQFLGVSPGSVLVDRRGLAHLAAKQVVQGHPGLLALDVPKRLVHARDGVVQHRPVAPVAVGVHQPPQLPDASGIPAHQQWLQVGGDGLHHGPVALGERGAAPAIQARLRRLHLDEDEVLGGGAGGYDLDRFDVKHGLSTESDRSDEPGAALSRGRRR